MTVAVVGLHGGEWFGRVAGAAVGAAEVVVGAPRHLDAVAAAVAPGAVVRPLTGPLDAVVDGIAADAAAGRRVCVLASGDPGFFGIVRALSARLGPAALDVHPAPSSVALAFGRLGRSWDDATVVSAHGRSLAVAVAAVTAALSGGAPAVAVLTGPDTPPQVVAAALVAAGVPAACPVAVASRLGDADEAVTDADLAGVAAGEHDPRSVLVVTPSGPAGRPGVAHRLPAGGWALDEAAFAHRDGMVTKAEVRAVVLARLALPAAGVCWDLGAGSGSVAVECARLAPGLRVLAVERDPAACALVTANAARHGVAVEVVEGAAPAALGGLPDPDRVFVGGGGPAVLDAALDRLRPGGVAVATFAVADSALHAARRLGNLVQLSVSRGVPTGSAGTRLRAENPVFVAWGQR